MGSEKGGAQERNTPAVQQASRGSNRLGGPSSPKQPHGACVCPVLALRALKQAGKVFSLQEKIKLEV